MHDGEASPITLLLQAASRGEQGAGERLLALVYDELHQMAGAQLAREAGPRTLQATALVHEAYLRLFGGSEPDWQNRAYFFGAAAEAMRRILIDAARRRNADKRRGRTVPEQAACDVADDGTPDDRVDLLALDEALSRMEQQDPRMASIVKLRYFVELSVDDTAAALGLSRRTVLRDWMAAKAWLHNQLAGGDERRHEP
jgi:RNA polymerase sigma factor (TIGR02999 family)